MKNYAVFLIIIVVAVWFWLRPVPKDPEVESTETVTSVNPTPNEIAVTPSPSMAATPLPQAPANKDASPSDQAPAFTSATPQPTVGKGPPRPPPGSVSYHKMGRLIVVFGDVLYGSLKDDSAPDTGYVRINPVRQWVGAIPYHIAPDLVNPDRVKRAIDYFHEKTPVRFVPFTGQADAITFQKGEKDCHSYVGRIGGHQPIYLSPDCDGKEIIHEIMHALGFMHEHSRSDRDQFVRVLWDRVLPDKRSQFEIAPDELLTLSIDRPFDYKSVMIYEPNFFGINEGETTLESTTREKIEPAVGGLSAEDIERLYRVYPP
jgi:hypothetical protein